MSWSENENSRFEQALADIEEDHPQRWQLVAQAVGGGRTAHDAWRHFLKLQGDTDDMAAQNRAARRREQYHRRRQHGADANGNNRRNDRRRSNGGAGASGSNSNSNNTPRAPINNNNRANRQLQE